MQNAKIYTAAAPKTQPKNITACSPINIKRDQDRGTKIESPILHYTAVGAVVGWTLTRAQPGHDDKEAHCKNSKDSWSSDMKNKKLELLLEGMWPNIFLIGRALYLAVREAVKAVVFPEGEEHSLLAFY